MHTNLTAELSQDWDLVLDSNGDLSLLRGAKAICQNVCNEGRVFKNDLYFESERGIAWFDDQLAKPLQEAITTANLRDAALRVPGVVSVNAITLSEIDLKTRVLKGVVDLTTEGGENGRSAI